MHHLPAGVLLMKYHALPMIGKDNGPTTLRIRNIARIEL